MHGSRPAEDVGAESEAIGIEKKTFKKIKHFHCIIRLLQPKSALGGRGRDEGRISGFPVLASMQDTGGNFLLNSL